MMDSSLVLLQDFIYEYKDLKHDITPDEEVVEDKLDGSDQLQPLTGIDEQRSEQFSPTLLAATFSQQLQHVTNFQLSRLWVCVAT